MRNKQLLIVLITLIILVGFGLIWRNYWILKEEVLIATDNTKYEKEGVLKITVTNNLRRNICFSSCYPYYLEKKNGEWKSYIYGDCQETNLNETCINPGQEKTFEINLSLVEKGLHRIAVPVCTGCKIGENFREDKRFYSNEFMIKEK